MEDFQIETAVMTCVYLQRLLSSIVQLQRDTLIANLFLQKDGQGCTWKVSITSEEALSPATAICVGDEKRNMAEHCWAQWAVPFSLKQRANMSHQFEHFSKYPWRALKRWHVIWLHWFPRSCSQMCFCSFFESRGLAVDGHAAPEIRKARSLQITSQKIKPFSITCRN